ncbi:hypothetical protein [Methylibium petroleiphilum]|uniref:Transmembrane protein n=1 Tax=Methylibium petroleiphilum (strain ATCC BAA-1232 / LMG 22953 / PM1) TaxID=420662 RepID=A2SPB3_METPP|nr:hypothetical protein [Methylibium petroleiphilum]ABM97402.1 hypothetical protein Mpe_B0638 [Methylibium petroleiphilum PM1]
MKESQFGFEYTWSDLEPIRALTVVVLAGQVAGAAAGVLVPQFADWFKSLWFGGAIATFPAFLVGLIVQSRWRPGSLGQNKVMVRRLGLVAAALTVFAFAMPVLELKFGKHTG